MQKRDTSPYQINTNYNIFQNIRVLPLIEGKDFLKSRKNKNKMVMKDQYLKMKQRVLQSTQNGTLGPKLRIPMYSGKRNFQRFNNNPYAMHQEKMLNQRSRCFCKMPEKSRKFYENVNFLEQLNGCVDCHVNLLKSRMRLSKQLNQTKENVKNYDSNPKKSEIFKNKASVREIIPMGEEIKSSRETTPDLDDSKLFSDLNEFKKLAKFLLKFLIGKPITVHECKHLSRVEIQILLLFINKKKRSDKKESELSEEMLKKLNKNWTKKRFEENLRYLVNKILKFLQNHFKSTIYDKVRQFLNPQYILLNQNAIFDYCFYGYYFLDATNYIEKPIEVYFHPKSRRNPNLKKNKSIPRTISQNYLNNLRTSKLFIRDLVTYLKHCLEAEAKNNIISKLEKMCKEWEYTMKSKGKKHLIEMLTKMFTNNPKCKLPWGIQEVREAVEKMLVMLGQS